MFTDPLKDSLTDSVKSFSQTLGSALWEPFLSMKATFQKTIRTKPVADALARAQHAVHRQRLLEHLEAVIMTSLCTPAHKKLYKQFIIGTGREQFAQHTTFGEAAQAFRLVIPTMVAQHKQELSALEMKHVALVLEKMQTVIESTSATYAHASLSDSAGAFGEPFAKDAIQKQTTTHLHDLRDVYIQDAKQLLHMQQELLSLLKHMGTPQFKSQQPRAKALLDEIVKIVQKMTILEKQLGEAEKSYAKQFEAWMQLTMRGSKQTQKQMPDIQHNYLQATQKVLDQREQVQQSWIAELHTRGSTTLPLEDILSKEASFWLQWSSLNVYATGLEAQAYTLDIQLYQGWVSLLEQHQDMLHTLHAHAKAYSLIASLMSHIKKQHLRLSQDILQVLIERKVIHNESKVETRLDRVQRIHTVIQHWIRDDERASIQRKDNLQAMVMQEGRIPLLKGYLTRMLEYATTMRGQHILEASMRTLTLQQQLFPYMLQALGALQASHTNADKLLTLQREDAQKTYAFKPSVEQEKIIADLETQYAHAQQAGQLLNHLQTHAQGDQEAVVYLMGVYRSQAKQLKLQAKKTWSQIKKLLPSVKKQIPMYPGFPVVSKDTIA